MAAALLSFQTTEFAIKLSILSSLTVVCALVPLIDTVVRRLQAEAQRRPAEALASALPRWRQVTAAVRNPVIVAATVITLAAPVNTAALAGNEEVLLIERGLAGKNAQ